MEDYKKKYEEALENFKKIKAANKDKKELVDFIEYEYPELKESEDERIRKHLIKHFGNKSKEDWNGVPVKSILAWLEKQDPKKHEEELEKAYKTADEVQYKKGYEDAKREFEKQGEQKPISITDEWIEDYWKYHKVTNPNSYDKGDEIQFDHDGFLRFCQANCKKSAWSEEDEKIMNQIVSNLEKCIVPGFPVYIGGVELGISWLKSLKERYTWKPSDDQMDALNIAIVEANLFDSAAGDKAAEILASLYEQLKKLKGE